MRSLFSFVFFLAITFASFSSASKLRFDGHKVLRFIPENEKQLKVLADLHLEEINNSSVKLDFWLEPRAVGIPVDIRVTPETISSTQRYFKSKGMSYSVFIEDVQTLLERQLETGSSDDFFSSYHTYDEIVKWLNDQAKLYPTIAKVVTVGSTFENRTLYGIKITGTGKSPKPGVFFDGGIHAREWITTASVVYMIGQLLGNYGKDSTVTNLVDQLEWTAVPVFNADGYSYTFTNDRMWRKTRSANKGSSCVGTDPNRNWAYEWDGAGTSSNPCSESYSGPKAVSEVCVSTISEYIAKQDNIKGYINFHSYSQLWMSPWGYTNKLPPAYKEQNDLSAKCVAALQAVHGTKYTYGPIATTIYPASGSSCDWTYGKLNIVWSYGVELRDTGKYGFLLPADQIVPTGEETFAAVKVWAQHVLDDSNGKTYIN